MTKAESALLPIFVNENFVLLRPMAGKRIMDVFLDGASGLTVGSAPNISGGKDYRHLEKLSMDFAYDTFRRAKGETDPAQSGDAITNICMRCSSGTEAATAYWH